MHYCNTAKSTVTLFRFVMMLILALPVMAQVRDRQDQQPPRDRQALPQRPQQGQRAFSPNAPRLIDRGAADERFSQLIRRIQSEKMNERLKLSPEQQEKFMERYKLYQDDFADNFKKLQTAMRQLEEMQMSNASENAIDEKTREVLSLRNASTEILPKHLNTFRELLSARQAAELVMFERDFLRDITKVIREARRREVMRQGRGGQPE